MLIIMNCLDFYFARPMNFIWLVGCLAKIFVNCVVIFFLSFFILSFTKFYNLCLT